MKARDFDRKFDSGDDVTADLDVSKSRRLNQEPRRINVDFPTWMVEALDREAKRLGVTRQSIIKIWIAEMLERRGAAGDVFDGPTIMDELRTLLSKRK